MGMEPGSVHHQFEVMASIGLGDFSNLPKHVPIGSVWLVRVGEKPPWNTDLKNMSSAIRHGDVWFFQDGHEWFHNWNGLMDLRPAIFCVGIVGHSIYFTSSLYMIFEKKWYFNLMILPKTPSDASSTMKLKFRILSFRSLSCISSDFWGGNLTTPTWLRLGRGQTTNGQFNGTTFPKGTHLGFFLQPKISRHKLIKIT